MELPYINSASFHSFYKSLSQPAVERRADTPSCSHSFSHCHLSSHSPATTPDMRERGFHLPALALARLTCRNLFHSARVFHANQLQVVRQPNLLPNPPPQIRSKDIPTAEALRRQA